MKLFTNKNFKQKIILALVIVILFNFLMPVCSQAVTGIGGDLLKELVKLFIGIGDVVNGIMNKVFLGTTKMYNSAILDYGSDELEANLDKDSGSSLAYVRSDGTPPSEDKGDTIVTLEKGFLFEGQGWLFDTVQVPNILYCPENMFANKIAMLDVNFINPNKYTDVEVNSASDDEASISLTERTGKKNGQTLREIIASWYRAFRNIAIVGLLIVLVYIGIRIMISSTSTDKAKYKENLQDWFVALCLVFFIHYIMAGILTVTEKFTELIDDSVDPAIYVDASKAKENDTLHNDKLKNLQFRTTITGYVRFMSQADETGDAIAYSIMFFALTIYTIMFTVTYVRRFLYVAFFTMIAPLVALTYPLDKIRDGKAQAFNMWFKEYTMNVIIQPVHLLLFSVFIGSVMDLVAVNPIYAIIAMGFLIPAEKFIKKLFGLEASTTASGLGEIAGGALAMKGMSNLIGKFSGLGKNEKDGKDQTKIKTRGLDPSVENMRLEDVIPDQYAALGRGSQTRGGQPRRGQAGGDQTESQPAGGLPPEGASPEGGPVGGLPPEGASPEGRPAGGLPPERASTAGGPAGGLPPEGASQEGRLAGGLPPEGASQEGRPAGGLPPEGYYQAQRASGTRNQVRMIGSAIPPEGYKPDIGTGLRAVGRKKVQTIKNTVAKPIKKGDRLKAARTAGKLIGAGLGAATLGTVAAGAALTTGDLSKGASMIGAGMTLGANANASIADATVRATGNMLQSDWDTFNSNRMELDEYERREQEKMDKAWIKDPKNYEYLRQRGFSHEQARAFLNSSRLADYRKKTGIDDIKTLQKTMSLVEKNGYSEDYGYQLARMVNNSSPEFKESERNNIRKNMEEQNGLSREVANRVIEDMMSIKGLK